MCIVFAYYYPLKKMTITDEDGEDISIPWLCGYDDDEPGLEACRVEHNSFPSIPENLLDRAFGNATIAGLQCNDVVDNGEGGNNVDDDTSGSLALSTPLSIMTMVSIVSFLLVGSGI